MHTKEELSNMVEEFVSSLEFPVEPERLYSPIFYSLETGGKRLRPLMLMLACNAFSDDVSTALPCAAAVEMFHNFTLLHDDIMDKADVRRGRSSVHKKWNCNIAILSGDAMVIYSYKLLQQAPAGILPGIMLEFNNMAMGVCEGQQFDIDFESMDEVSVEQYMKMIRLKTAVLMAGAVKIGAMLGGADRQGCDILERFGTELGTAFQLQDDYLDTYGTRELLGKKIGGDIMENKKTFLMITALNEAGSATRRALLATLKDANLHLEHKLGRVKTIFNSLAVPEITRSAIEEHLDKAMSALDELNVEPSRVEPLRELVTELRNRNN